MVDYKIVEPGWTCIISDRIFSRKLKKYYKRFTQLENSSYKILDNELVINIKGGIAYIWRSGRKITYIEVEMLVKKVEKND